MEKGADLPKELTRDERRDLVMKRFQEIKDELNLLLSEGQARQIRLRGKNENV